MREGVQYELRRSSVTHAGCPLFVSLFVKLTVEEKMKKKIIR